MTVSASCLAIVVAGAVCAAAQEPPATPAPGRDLPRRADGQLAATGSRLLSSFSGSHRWPTLSPDGSMIAFVSDADGSPQIWVKSLAGGDPIRITSGTLNPSHPSWSPKNDQIVFQGGEDLGSQSLWSVPPGGGPPRRILERAFAPSFSADGTKIAFHRRIEGVWVCNADGSGERRVEGLSGEETAYVFDDGPAFSPDGTLLTIYAAMPGTRDVWVVPVAGGTPRRLTSDDCEGGHPVWTPDGRTIVYSSKRTGSRNLWRIAVGGGKPEPVTTGAGDDDEPAISRDRKELVYTTARDSYALMVLDTTTGESRQLLEQPTPIAWPSLSPAGDWVAFGSSDLGGGGQGSQVLLVASGGTRLHEVASADRFAERFVQPLHWSADGRFLYIWEIRTGSGAEAMVSCKLPVGGGPCVAVSGFRYGGHGTWGLPTFSPDDRRVALYGAQGGQPLRGFVLDLASGSTVTLPLLLEIPRWSHDGRYVVGTVAGSNEIFICSPDGSPCGRPGAAIRGTMPFWSHDDSRVIFFSAGQPRTTWEVRMVNRDASGERVVGQLPMLVVPSGFPLGLSRDDKVPWVQLRPGRHEIWMADLQH